MSSNPPSLPWAKQLPSLLSTGWFQEHIQGSLCFLEQNIYPHCLVLVGFRNTYKAPSVSLSKTTTLIAEYWLVPGTHTRLPLFPWAKQLPSLLSTGWFQEHIKCSLCFLEPKKIPSLLSTGWFQEQNRVWYTLTKLLYWQSN